MKKIILSIILSVVALSSIQAQDIAAERAKGVGAEVTIRGVVINGAELGLIRYVQDRTGGLAVYYGTITPAFSSVKLGDSVTVTGKLKQYNNLLEIDPITTYTVNASGKTLPKPIVVTPADLNKDDHEGKLVVVNNCKFGVTGNFDGGTSGKNYTLTSNGQSVVLRVLPGTNLVGTAIPTGNVNITAVLSQFCASPANGCTTGYQLLPRTTSDIVNSSSGSVNQPVKSSSLKVVPNPANDRISVKLKEGEIIQTITIYDAFGRVILVSNEDVSTVDVSSLINGMYYMNVMTSQSTYNVKINIVK